MNIVIFSRSTFKHFATGGMESHLKILSEGLVENGHDVLIITTSLSVDNPHNIEENINDVEYLFLAKTTSGLNPLTTWEQIFYKIGVLKRGTSGEGELNYFNESNKAFQKSLQKEQFDLIISQSTVAKGISSPNGTPLISIIHGTIFDEIRNRFNANKTLFNWIRFLIVDLPRWITEHYFSNRRFFGRVNKVIAVSETLKRSFVGDYPSLREITEVIYNGVDTDFFKPSEAKYPSFTILFVGRMDREKGVDLILQAIHLLREKKLRIEAKLVGTGIHLNELKKLSEHLGVNTYCEFVGEIPNSEVKKYYEHSHIFVLPSRRKEGHPVVISEALACGLPIICTRSGGLNELIDDSRTGFFVPLNSYHDIAKNIEKLFNDRNLLQLLSNQARKSAEDRFSKRAMIQRYLEIFKTTQKNA